jgi:hypothetical protein
MLRKYYRSKNNNHIKNIVSDLISRKMAKKILKLPVAQQKYATCSFVNLKTLIYGLLTAMRALEPKINGKATESATLWKQSRDMAYHDYKNFTHFMRDGKIHEILNNIKVRAKKTPESDDIEIDIAILLSYLMHHHGQSRDSSFDRTHKQSTEKSRANQIITSLLPVMDKWLLDSMKLLWKREGSNAQSIIINAALHTEDLSLIKKVLNVNCIAEYYLSSPTMRESISKITSKLDNPSLNELLSSKSLLTRYDKKRKMQENKQSDEVQQSKDLEEKPESKKARKMA